MNFPLKSQIFTTDNTMINNEFKFHDTQFNNSKEINTYQNANKKLNSDSNKKRAYYKKINNHKKLLSNKLQIIDNSLNNFSKSITKKNHNDGKTFYKIKFNTFKDKINKENKQNKFLIKNHLIFDGFQTCKNNFHKRHFSFFKNSESPNEKTCIIPNINNPNIFLYKNYFKKYNTNNILRKKLINLNFHEQKHKKNLLKNTNNKKYQKSKNSKKLVDNNNNKNIKYKKNLKLLAKESDKRINIYKSYFKFISNVINEISDLAIKATNHYEKSVSKGNNDLSCNVVETENKNNIFENKTIIDHYYIVKNNFNNDESSCIASSKNGDILQKMLDLSDNIKKSKETIFQLSNNVNNINKLFKNNTRNQNDVCIEKLKEVNNHTCTSGSSLDTIKNSGVSMTFDKSKKDNIIVNKKNTKEKKESWSQKIYKQNGKILDTKNIREV